MRGVCDLFEAANPSPDAKCASTSPTRGEVKMLRLYKRDEKNYLSSFCEEGEKDYLSPCGRGRAERG